MMNLIIVNKSDTDQSHISRIWFDNTKGFAVVILFPFFLHVDVVRRIGKSLLYMFHQIFPGAHVNSMRLISLDTLKTKCVKNVP